MTVLGCLVLVFSVDFFHAYVQCVEGKLVLHLITILASRKVINVKKSCLFIAVCKAHCSVTHIKQQKLISSPQGQWIECADLIISTAFEMMKLIFAVLYVSLNDGPYNMLHYRSAVIPLVCAKTVLQLC